MATYTQIISASFGASKTGEGTNVGYKVVDSGGTTQISRTTSGITEENDAAGNATTGTYRALPTFDTSWSFPVRVLWDITGQAGVAAQEVLDSRYGLNDLTQSIPTSNTAQTVGDALNAARAQGFGKWVKSGTTINLYAGDGSTVVRTFTLDSADEPTSRI